MQVVDERRPASTPVEPLVPVAHHVVAVRAEVADVVTLVLAADEGPTIVPEPGRFSMLYVPGVGEAAISVSDAPPDADVVGHTIRVAGATTRALCALRPGDPVGVRGPFGTRWPMERLRGRDVVVVGGGIGLAPLRPAILDARGAGARSLAVAVGAREPGQLLYGSEYDDWGRLGEVAVTVDVAAPGWTGEVGLVTEPLARLVTDPGETVALVCGPEPMMVAAARHLVELGVPADDVHVSIERNMRCGVGLCGHCQVGPLLVCRDGPVVPWSRARPLLEVRRW